MDRQFIRAIVGVFCLLAALFFLFGSAGTIVLMGRAPEGLDTATAMVNLAWTMAIGVVFAAAARHCLRIRRP